MIARFTELGAQISDAWRARRKDERAFPEIARRALEEAALERTYDFDTLVDALAVIDPLPSQGLLDESFGQPPINVFQGDGFYIEVLFWIDGLVSIHQHGFSGAFTVFEGSSVHTRYRFTQHERINDTIAFGDLAFLGAELLTRGDVREILAGPSLIHATFHLDRPTVSIVVRSDRDYAGLPQWDYRPPTLAFDPFATRPTQRKRLQLLRMLHRSRRDAYWRATESVLGVSDWHTAYLVLEHAYTLSDDPADRARLGAIARAVHGDEIDALTPVLVAAADRRFLVGRRDSEEDDELRFFLAVVLTVPSRDVALELMSKRFPNEPAIEVALRNLKKLGLEHDALVLARALLSGDNERSALKARLAREEVGFENDYALLKAVRTLRDAPGLRALFT